MKLKINASDILILRFNFSCSTKEAISIASFTALQTDLEHETSLLT